MTEMKKNSTWLIPFSYQEVIVWDTIVIPSRNNWVDEYWDSIRTKYYKYYVQKKSNKRDSILVVHNNNIHFFADQWCRIDTMEFETYIQNYWISNIRIDRRSRYKRLLDSLLELIR